jgi:AcrR family transcriptional regulator
MSDPHQPLPENHPSRDPIARRRRAILEATAAVCAENGYPDATVAEIASRARIGIDAFHGVFADKEEAFLALLSIEAERLLRLVEEACDKSEAPASRIGRALVAVLEWVDENPRDARICIIEPTRATRSVFERREETLERLALLLRSNAPPGPSVAPELIEEMLVAGVCEVLGGRLGSGDTGRAVDLAPELTELVLGPYQPPRS